jgi:MoaA/NifB/PqqE/SkfB family radical SAM enzyme
LPPILLHYYITERCNCRCTFCDIWKTQTHKSADARFEDIHQNLREARQLGVRFVDFTGGEPLLHDDLPEMLGEAKRLGLQTTLTTNGLLYPKRAESLSGRVNFLHFSLDALSAKKHDTIRGQRSFQHVMQSLDAARELGETPDLLFTVNEQNISYLKPMSEFARALGLMLIVNPVFSYAAFNAPDLQLLQKIDKFRATPFVYVNSAFNLLRRRGGNQVKFPRCRVVDSTIVISPDNKLILPCYHFRQKSIDLSEESAKIPKKQNGNLLRQIQNSKMWKYYQRRQGRFDFCQGCHLNCYFDPSFFYKIDDYFWTSLVAKSRYWHDKNILRRLWRKKHDSRPALDIAQSIMKKYDANL